MLSLRADLSLIYRWCRCCCCCGWAALPAAVVFGRVVEGMAVVKRIEALGSANGSGKTRGRITVADCGQVCCKAGLMMQHLLP